MARPTNPESSSGQDADDQIEQATEIAGVEREEEYKVGDKHPPKEHQFKPGNQVGKGRRNGFHLKPLLKKKLSQFVPGDKQVRTYAEVLVETEILRAIKKGGDSARRVWEYIEGKAEQPIDATFDGLMKVIVEYADSQGHDPEAA